MKPIKTCAAVVALGIFGIVGLSPPVSAAGLIRSIWGCQIPCESKSTHQTLTAVYVTYCSTSSLSTTMIQNVTPVCQAQNPGADAVAVRNGRVAPATCDSSSNSCANEGIVEAGYTCQMLCPSQDDVIHKFTACAKTGSEAWNFAPQICKDAKMVPAELSPTASACVAAGQTACPAL
jgi:hypothetical protein